MIINADINSSLNINCDWSDFCKRYNKKEAALSLELYLLSQDARCKYTNNLNTTDLFLVILILFVLEPEFKAKQDTAVNIVNIYTPKLAIKAVSSVIYNQKQKLYLQNINLIPYFATLNLNYVMIKLNLSSSLSCILKSNLGKIMSIDLINTSNLQRLLQYNNLSNQLSNTVFKFLTYIIMSEASYLVSSCNLYAKLRTDAYATDIKVINYGYEVLLYHSSQIYLTLWKQVFLQIMQSNKQNQAINTIQKNYFINNVNFLGYYFILQKSTLVSVEPCKDSQILLFRKINLLFLKLKSNSAVSLINSINHLLKEWSAYFTETRAKKVFALIDYLIYLKIRAWMFRNHPSWGRRKIMSKYFLVETKYVTSSIEQTHRLFYTRYIVDGKKRHGILIRLKDLLI